MENMEAWELHDHDPTAHGAGSVLRTSAGFSASAFWNFNFEAAAVARVFRAWTPAANYISNLMACLRLWMDIAIWFWWKSNGACCQK